MKDAEIKTLREIVAEMRGIAKLDAACRDMIPRSHMALGMRTYADRIEAAAKREEIELREDEAKMLLHEYAAAPDESLTPSALELKRELLRLAPETPGNAAAMREALGKNTEEAYLLLDILPDEMISAIDAASNVLEESEAALSAPARNCDVGTPEEQMRRFEEFCMSHKTFTQERVKEGKTCTACPCMGAHRCQIAWGQMPYEAEGGAQ